MRVLQKHRFHLSKAIIRHTTLNGRAATRSEDYFNALYGARFLSYLHELDERDLWGAHDADLPSCDEDDVMLAAELLGEPAAPLRGTDEPPDDLRDIMDSLGLEAWFEVDTGEVPDDTFEDPLWYPDPDRFGDDELLAGGWVMDVSDPDRLMDAWKHGLFHPETRDGDEDTGTTWSLPADERLQQFHAFHRRYLARLAVLEAELPAAIRDQIADLRILALGECTAEVRMLLDQYLEAEDVRMRTLIDEAEQAMRVAFGGEIPQAVRKLQLYDCRILAIEAESDRYLFHLDHGYHPHTVFAVAFERPKLLELETYPIDARWLLTEVYPREQGLEIHLLLDVRREEASGFSRRELKHLTLEASAVNLYATNIRVEQS